MLLCKVVHEEADTAEPVISCAPDGAVGALVAEGALVVGEFVVGATVGGAAMVGAAVVGGAVAQEHVPVGQALHCDNALLKRKFPPSL